MTISPTSVANAEHYVWGNVCHGWRLLHHEALSVIQERVPPGAGEVPHFHTRSRQFFYVLEGRLLLESEGRSMVLGPGEGAHVPPGVEHRVRNTATEDTTFLVVSSPSTTGDRTDV